MAVVTDPDITEIAVNNPPFLRAVTGGTIMCWMQARTSIVATSEFMRVRGGVGADRLTLYVTDSFGLELSAVAADADTPVTKTSAATGLFSRDLWFHFAAVANYANDLAFIYLNGANVALTGGQTAAFTGTQTSDTNSLNLTLSGVSIDGESFAPTAFEDARVYGRALGPLEIMSIYTARGADGIVSGLQSRHHFMSRPPGILLSDVVGGEPNVAMAAGQYALQMAAGAASFVPGTCRLMRQKQGSRARLGV